MLASALVLSLKEEINQIDLQDEFESFMDLVYYISFHPIDSWIAFEFNHRVFVAFRTVCYIWLLCSHCVAV